NPTVKVLDDESKVEFIVVSDLFLTPSARYADLLLPATSFMARWPICEPWCTGNYLLLSQQLLVPEFARRSAYALSLFHI
ncbi:hypothetical protein AUM95_22935, partial [Cronobacter sakazakii]|uniref:molybdopterin-dependent oxidoreductase n=1 Tax=Cronobacter sakazakii TaxID=28141 RepID=UPI000D51D91B